MSYQIQVENIKCGGCANHIRKQLLQLDGITAIEVDIEHGIVEIEGSAAQREQVVQTLLKSGYPETGAVEGLHAAGAKAKSFVSCAIGRMSPSDSK